jgi:hypothetical protein
MGLFTNPLGHAGYPPGASAPATVVNSTVRAATAAESAAGVLTDVYISPATAQSATALDFASPPVLGYGSTTPAPVAATTLSTSGIVTLASGATPGLIAVTPASDTQASPSAASTVNSRVGTIAFTGFTTAAGGEETFTITNSLVTANSAIFVSISNLGANDARFSIARVFPGAGSFVVIAANSGIAALNGDIRLNFWVIN